MAWAVSTETRAALAYAAYAAASLAAGHPLPVWTDLPDSERDLWRHAALAVEQDCFRATDAHVRDPLAYPWHEVSPGKLGPGHRR